MALDLKKHKEAIIAAWKDVSNPDSNNTWAIFGYEGQTGVLKVIEVGDGEFDEMVENLNSGMIQYAYCRVKDPNTKLAKYVLINWQGDGAPDTWKGRCAGHFKEISSLLRGAHLTINARDEADLDKDDVLKQVAKSSGAQYSIHKEEPRREDSPSGPVGSVYKKVVPQAEIRVSERDQFWERNELEEKKRREAETKEKAEIQKKIDQERIAREKQEAHERERKIQEHARQVEMQKQAERAANQAAAAANQKTSSHVDDDDSERRNKSEMLRQQRAAEAASLVKQRENNPKEMFKQRERAYSQEEPVPVKAPPRPLPKTIPREDQRSVPVAVEPPPPVRSHAPVDVPVQQRQMPREPSPPPREPSPPPREPSPPPREPSPEPVKAEPVITRMMSQGLPKRQDSDEEEEEQDWDAPTHEDFSHVIDPYQQKNEPEVHGEGGIMARALYDYTATAEDEVSFDPNDLITEIDKVDDGWWIGTAPSGCRGLFPANYVELI